MFRGDLMTKVVIRQCVKLTAHDKVQARSEDPGRT